MQSLRPALVSFIVASLLTLTAHAQEEVPFVTTPDKVTMAMLELAEVRSTDRLIDLGSGDGRIVIAAARRFGATALGVEIVPDLVERSRASATAAGVSAKASFVEQDLFKTDLSGASVVTMYLLPEVNLQLRPQLLRLTPGTRVVSHDWDMGDWPPDQTVTLDVPDKTIGREKRSRVHLWWVPAPAGGLWCGPQGQALHLEQRFQMLQARLDLATGASLTASGRVQGATLTLQGLRAQLQFKWISQGQLVQMSADGPAAVGSAMGIWRRATESSSTCPT